MAKIWRKGCYKTADDNALSICKLDPTSIKVHFDILPAIGRTAKALNNSFIIYLYSWKDISISISSDFFLAADPSMLQLVWELGNIDQLICKIYIIGMQSNRLHSIKHKLHHMIMRKWEYEYMLHIIIEGSVF